jgi:hypothetical protein
VPEPSSAPTATLFRGHLGTPDHAAPNRLLAPNAPLRTAVTALAPGATTALPAPNQEPATEAAHRRAARYAWALLLARIYEVYPLVCPDCGGAMRIIAFITDAPTVRDILDHLGVGGLPQRRAAGGCDLGVLKTPSSDRNGGEPPPSGVGR